ncbi:complement C1q-like protein 4 [Mercenaria mercenaria]|uniref:complement C1q-like protein 4 n=1 Tax=Mercenaria mercenaria TaxID=6596 RepID=UPI00234E7838|nr:complement C1q-like protein 4 [Mercenaria mercenaria]
MSQLHRYAVLLTLCLNPFAQGRSYGLEPDVECSRFACEYRVIEKLISLQNENARLEERIKKLEQNKHTAVSAYVRLSKTIPLGNSERVMYDIAVTNVGDAYDFQKGQFTAPVSGIYLVHLSACLGNGGQWMNLNIVHDGAVIGKLRSGDSAYVTCTSNSISIHLNVEDNVWIERDDGSSTGLNEDHGWNSFTASLIHAD